jgi:hypothetical protein
MINKGIGIPMALEQNPTDRTLFFFEDMHGVLLSPACDSPRLLKQHLLCQTHLVSGRLLRRAFAVSDAALFRRASGWGYMTFVALFEKLHVVRIETTRQSM